MTVLLTAGVAVLVLGAIVLLRFPDRPGGKIAWQNFEVSSIGAGLPLIVVGLVAISFGSGIGRDGEPDRAAPPTFGGNGGGTLSCEDALGEVPPGRVARVEIGAHDQIVVRPDQSKAEPFALLLEDGGARIGSVRARFAPQSGVFLLEAVVDGACDAATVTNLTSPGVDPARPLNYSELRLALGSADVVLTLKGGSDVRVDLRGFTP